MPRELRRAQSCLNCGAEVTRNFCAECGQENTDYRVSLRRLLGDLAEEVFQLESRLWRTLWTLVRHPGRLTLDYNAGRRVRYTSPLRLYLLASVLYFFAAGFFTPRDQSIISVDLGHLTLDSSPDDNPLWRQLDRRLGAVQEDPRAARQRGIQTVSEWAPRVMVLLLPMFALLTQLFFRRPRRFYVEHLVFALHLHAVTFLLLAVFTVARHQTQWLLAPLIATWLTIAAHRVYEQSGWRLAWKLPLLALAYGLVVAVGIGVTMAVGMLLV